MKDVVFFLVWIFLQMVGADPLDTDLVKTSNGRLQLLSQEAVVGMVDKDLQLLTQVLPYVVSLQDRHTEEWMSGVFIGYDFNESEGEEIPLVLSAFKPTASLNFPAIVGELPVIEQPRLQSDGVRWEVVYTETPLSIGKKKSQRRRRTPALIKLRLPNIPQKREQDEQALLTPYSLGESLFREAAVARWHGPPLKLVSPNKNERVLIVGQVTILKEGKFFEDHEIGFSFGFLIDARDLQDDNITVRANEVFFQGDVAVGMEGAPVFNQRAELLGVVAERVIGSDGHPLGAIILRVDQMLEDSSGKYVSEEEDFSHVQMGAPSCKVVFNNAESNDF